jgi:two-component system response regulator RpfG
MAMKRTVLVVDDQPTARLTLDKLVGALPNVGSLVSYESPLHALDWARSNHAELALIDYHMPGLTGIDLTRSLRELDHFRDVPIVIVTHDVDRDVRLDALEAGATDFLLKPVDVYEFRARCTNLLQLHQHTITLRDRNQTLEREISDATEAIRLREQETLRRLAKAGEYRDEETGQHIERMARYSRLIAEHFGLSTVECETIALAAPMHDIGKIGIPDEVLLKPGRHTEQERFIMRQHAIVGYEILKGSPSRYLQAGAVIALSHHEKFDGSGYPGGLRGEEIPQAGRVVAIADVFDALTSKRPYKEPWPFERAVEYVASERGKHFDPDLADAFLANLRAVREIYEKFRDVEVESPVLRNLR